MDPKALLALVRELREMVAQGHYDRLGYQPARAIDDWTNDELHDFIQRLKAQRLAVQS